MNIAQSFKMIAVFHSLEEDSGEFCFLRKNFLLFVKVEAGWKCCPMGCFADL